MNNPVATFYQECSEVVAMKALSPVVRVEGKLVGWLHPVELIRTLKDGLERATFEVVDRIETLAALVDPNQQVAVTQVIQADPVSQARIEWGLFRGAICQGSGAVSGKNEGVEIIAKNNWVVANHFGRRIRLSLQRAGESLDLNRTNVAEADVDVLLDEAGRHDFSGSVVFPWIRPDIWPGDVVERIDGRRLNFGQGRMVQQVTLRFGNEWTTRLVFGGGA